MTERQTVATRDDDGNLWWFPVADAERWPGTTLDAGDMYFAAGRWLVLPTLAELTGKPARIVGEDVALDWLVCNGYSPPGELAERASNRRLGR